MESTILHSFLTELRRGSLTLIVLGALFEPHYGYDLLEILKEKGVTIEANTLYPLLRRLEKQGLLESTWDTTETRPRKYYQINETGENVFKELFVESEKLQNSIKRIQQGTK
ncbi:PadR family transcriptional regulator [Enterococcus canis]|uniref:PadR family transcriptional regulator n=1 Tax=Enterococcus canis TaxID=214095 RepID=A0A1L8RI37_9ENTE|nr:PadR family transcriptional regulator [Enterococcus canis]OJG19429.1 PadR family transcriptional regulator [Enterococcus canis]